ncbi:MAG: D-ribose pyranase [Clostridia bacterium]|nr:D-ribose pyranase [Clostridia bacterium]
MRKGRLLNSEIVATLAKLGHTDQLVIADAGLPIPAAVNRIDLALKKGVPGFMETLKVLSGDMVIEKVILAEEIKVNNGEMLDAILELLGETPVEFVTHEIFKSITGNSKAIIRTGECTAYANIILQSGVDFGGDSYD